MRIIFSAISAVAAALVLSACGEQGNSNSKAKNAVRETAEAVDKTADHATGKAQLEQKKKMETRLNRIQQDQNRQLNQALKEK
ncbi:MAG: hypothetical protein J5858_10560 [Lentisphaeria bacterium]|nr:hypothetical protein [Lentisphaeria bacterium]